MARYIAKNLVAAGIADEVEVQLAYAIGVSEPVSLYVDTFGTGKVETAVIEQKIPEIFDLTPAGIIRSLNLKQPIYRKTASYGHFGRSDVPWEITDKTDEIKKIIS
jgi:S-adenosylmethionine synthetase